MGWVIFWVLCGIASSIIAGNKGRSGFGWFVFGCLLGPFGILLALMVSKETQAERDAAGRAAWLVNTSPFGARCHRELQLWQGHSADSRRRTRHPRRSSRRS